MTTEIQTLPPEAFDELDTLLDGLRTQFDETPQWEFCEGFMAALVCCRRNILAAEYFPMLLDVEADSSALPARFTELWGQRWREVEDALDFEVDGPRHGRIIDRLPVYKYSGSANPSADSRFPATVGKLRELAGPTTI